MKLVRKRDEVFACTCTLPELPGEVFRGLPYEKNGVPSHHAIQMLGLLKNNIFVSKEDAKKFISGMDIKCSIEGLLAVEYQGMTIGKGMCRNGIMKNMVPKAKRMNVEFL